MSTLVDSPPAHTASPAIGMAGARLAAAAAAAGSAAHLSMLPAGGWMAALGVGMAGACLPCAWHLGRRPSAPAARALLARSLAMVLVHTVLVLAPDHAAARGAAVHAHPGTHVASSAPAPGTAGAGEHAEAMLAVVGADLVAAFLAAVWMGAARRARPVRATTAA